MKSTIVWDVTPCSPIVARCRFGGTYCPHHQVRRVSQARNLQEAGDNLTLACCQVDCHTLLL
jgi:hypothetical protein